MGTTWISARSWQLNPWHPDDKVVAYLAQFGLEAKDELDWEETPKESGVELKVSLDQHVENADATWYQLECKLLQKTASIEASWQAPRRLTQIRCSLHDRVSLALGSRYNWLFEDAHFALPFAPRGTTARLRVWFNALTDHINDGTLSPELAALTLFFLQVPLLRSDGEEAAAPDFYTPSQRRNLTSPSVVTDINERRKHVRDEITENCPRHGNDEPKVCHKHAQDHSAQN